uniref:hypothetical protein n=1 Tax=Streptosarcina arenaria TaxID=2058782 RepID=UPI00286C369C|nr:hypothetical protein RMD90_pgp030 [Streptosarcina arenaria]YP_010933451.1 hypothetical protein RMD90_pgp008 [Streptosarcina arenaria]WKT08830.1 hypothetical protein [Streptosarcina arenaria]WKT08831.1 hypothetical protein [Streptosarcina arenaria]
MFTYEAYLVILNLTAMLYAYIREDQPRWDELTAKLVPGAKAAVQVEQDLAQLRSWLEKFLPDNIEEDGKRTRDNLHDDFVALGVEIGGFAASFTEWRTEWDTFILADVARSSRLLSAIESEGEATRALIRESTDSILDAIGELPSKVRDAVREEFEGLSEHVSELVASKIVGQSYYRWDSTSSYYPTVQVNFVEQNVQVRPRRTQVSVRLPVRTEQVTEQVIAQLRSRFAAREGFHYAHGTLRATYVQTDKTFKTQVRVADRDQARSLLEFVLYATDQLFHPALLSYTEGPQRPGVTRRTQPLDGIPTAQQDYNVVFLFQLYRAVLLINGLERPIVLFKA